MKKPFPNGIKHYRVVVSGVCLEDRTIWGPLSESEGLPILELEPYFPIIGGVLAYSGLWLVRKYKVEVWIGATP
jgi:hypothetical protein